MLLNGSPVSETLHRIGPLGFANRRRTWQHNAEQSARSVEV